MIAEALEDLQGGAARLEAENRALRMGGSSTPGGRAGTSEHGSSGKVRKQTPLLHRSSIPSRRHRLCTWKI